MEIIILIKLVRASKIKIDSGIMTQGLSPPQHHQILLKAEDEEASIVSTARTPYVLH